MSQILKCHQSPAQPYLIHAQEKFHGIIIQHKLDLCYSSLIQRHCLLKSTNTSYICYSSLVQGHYLLT